MIRRSPGTEILLLYRFPVAAGLLTPAAIAKLAPYMTRYAQTLNVAVHAVGGVSDHVHILADVPSDMSADRVPRELCVPTARYLRDTAGVRGFAWSADSVAVVSVSPSERDIVAAYLAGQEERHLSGDLVVAWEAQTQAPDDTTTEPLPAWLTGALGSAEQ